jgi:hypothetical protein
MTEQKYSIRAVLELTGFSPSTLRQYEAEYPLCLVSQKVLVGNKFYRVYTWQEIEKLLYVKQKIKEGYSVSAAWDSYFEFDELRRIAAERMGGEVEAVTFDTEIIIEEGTVPS